MRVRPTGARLLIAVLVWLAGAGVGHAAAQEAARPIVVASKPFGESYLLCEMFAQLLEARGMRVDRRPGLGATEIAFAALRTGAIDVYPEYTGTGLLAILRDSLTDAQRTDPRLVYAHVARASADRWGVRWLPPLGFENTYAVAVRRETAERDGLRTLGDLARVGVARVAHPHGVVVGHALPRAGGGGRAGLEVLGAQRAPGEVHVALDELVGVALGEHDAVPGGARHGGPSGM
jgi:glycine betaine/choline ABC-type transport system substrate-binding protein